MSLLKRIFNFIGHAYEIEEKLSGKEQSGTEVLYADAIKQLNQFKRTAYVPEVINSQPHFTAESKMGGYPYLRHQDDWPRCSHCKNHLQLFLQLDLNSLPVEKDKGLLQLFYCTNVEKECESELEMFFPFSGGVVCRIILPKGESAKIQPQLNPIFTEKVIMGWEEVDDYPHFYEYDDLGIEVDDDTLELIEEREDFTTIAGDKLFGWPLWVQDVEYPNDRKTSRQMDMVFQIDSEHNLPYMFGDSGIGHLTQSKDNKEELAFAWACY